MKQKIKVLGKANLNYHWKFGEIVKGKEYELDENEFNKYCQLFVCKEKKVVSKSKSTFLTKDD